METKHNTPWVGDRARTQTHIKDASGELICSVWDADQAEFILRACNSHDKLLAACRNLVTIASQTTDLTVGEIAQLTEAEAAIAAAWTAAKAATGEETDVEEIIREAMEY